MDRIIIALRTTSDIKIERNVIDTLNGFHFTTIRITKEAAQIRLHVTGKGSWLEQTARPEKKLPLSDNFILKIQRVFSSYLIEEGRKVNNSEPSHPQHSHPFLDEWADDLEREILSFLKSAQQPRSGFGVLLTHDVDGIGKFYKGSLKTGILFAVNMIRTLNRPRLSAQYLAWSRRFLTGKVDYNGFPYIMKTASLRKFIPLFFLYAHLQNDNHLSLFEKLIGVNPNYRLASIKKVISFLKKEGAQIGLHGSYRSADDSDLLGKEIEQLQAATGLPCRCIRQHFLNFHGASTQRKYMDNGIKFDFTCGYVKENAFLCGTCRPFWGLQSRILVIPMIYMDAVSLYFKPADERQIITQVDFLLSVLKKFGGIAAFNFHQRMISAIPLMQKIYDQVAVRTRHLGGDIITLSDLEKIYSGNGQTPCVH